MGAHPTPGKVRNQFSWCTRHWFLLQPSAPSKESDQFGRGIGGAQHWCRYGAMALAQFAPAAVLPQQQVMTVDRLRQTKRALQRNLASATRSNIATTHNPLNTESRIIDHDGELVRHDPVAANHDWITGHCCWILGEILA